MGYRFRSQSQLLERKPVWGGDLAVPPFLSGVAWAAIASTVLALCFLLFDFVSWYRKRMTEQIKLIECPRDAWQGLPEQFHEVQSGVSEGTCACGIQAHRRGEFCFAETCQTDGGQRRSNGQLNASLPAGVQLPEIIGIVVNEKGLERAFATPGVTTIGYPYSISAYFGAQMPT